jgi:hypothetical protein
MDWMLLGVVKDRRPKHVKSNSKGEYEPATKDQLIDMLSHITPDREMGPWIGICSAIGTNFAEDIDLAIDIADEWSETGFHKGYICPRYDINEHGEPEPGYTRRDIERKLRNPKTTGTVTSMGSIVHLARQGGYGRLSAREAFGIDDEDDDRTDDEVLADIEGPDKDKHGPLNDPRAFLRNDQPYITKYFYDSLIEGMLPQGIIAYLIAKQNSGKTAFAAEMAVCVENGFNFFGHRCEKGKVLIIEKDDWKGLNQFLLASTLKHGLVGTRVRRRQADLVFATDQWKDKEIDEMVDLFVDRYIDDDYKLIIFETITSLFSAGKMDEAWGKKAANFIGALLRKLPNTTLLFVSHSARGDKVDTFGTSLLTHNAGCEIKLNRTSEQGPIEVYQGKTRAGFFFRKFHMKFKPVGEGRRYFKHSVAYLEVTEDPRASSAINEDADRTAKLVAMLEPENRSGRFSTSQVKTALGLKPSNRDLQRSEMEPWVKRLHDSGVLVRVSSGSRSEEAQWKVTRPVESEEQNDA